jgi:hypothetical protein
MSHLSIHRPRCPFDEWNLKVTTELTPWPLDGLRRASANGFGFGGTNAHVIVDDAYHFLKDHGLKGNHNCLFSDPGSSPQSAADSGVGMGSSIDWSDENQLLDTLDAGLRSKRGALNTRPRLLVW